MRSPPFQQPATHLIFHYCVFTQTINYDRPFIAAVAPALAIPISCLALTLLVTLGNPLAPPCKLCPRTAPVLVLLFPAPALTPLIPTPLIRLVPAPTLTFESGGLDGLTPLLPLTSRFRTAVPFLKLVAGGSGSGRLLAEGVVMVLCLLIGDSLRGTMRGAAIGMLDFWPVRNS
jgi:hypothetical protein